MYLVLLCLFLQFELFHVPGRFRSYIRKYISSNWRKKELKTKLIHVKNIYIYRVFTKEWCGFKNVLNDYILQLDGAPPIFAGMYESYAIVFSNSAGSEVLQMETTT
jgi:hypothetical protein